MKVFNVRYGFATNSSSSHSLILLADNQRLPDLAPDCGYGREVFTCASAAEKRKYFAAQLAQARSYQSEPGEAFASITDEMITTLTGIPPAEEYDEWEGPFGSIDHQSMWTFPLEWSGSRLHNRWLEEFRDFVIERDDVAVLGGDDEGNDHPAYREETAWGPNWLNRGELAPTVIARRDNDAGYWTLFDRNTGTRHRILFGSGPNPARASVPELVDLKLTNHCPFGCAFCYQASTSEGQHAWFDSIAAILRALASMQVFEVAIGGGEPTLHPDLDEIVQLARDLHIIPNLTTRNLTWLRNQTAESLARFGGIAYSVHSADDVTQLLKSIPDDTETDFRHARWRGRRAHVVAQLVLGTVSREEYREILQRTGTGRITLTLLAYKRVGFGANRAPIPYEWWLADYIAADQAARPSLHIDTPLAAAFAPQLEAAGIPSWLYDVQDGTFSFYIDAVTSRCAPSSYEADLSRSRPLRVGHDSLRESILYGFRQTRG